MRFFLLVILGLSAPRIASAYLLTPPRLTIVASPDGSALLRIDPGAWPHAGGEAARSGKATATATVFLYDAASQSYHVAKTFALRNPIAPTTAIISDGARFIVTCDDWDPEIGCTPNVVAIYRGSGELVKAWALEDIFSPAEIKRFGPFPINVPARRWRGEKVTFVTDSKGPAVWIPWANDLPWHVGLRLDLKSLTFEKHPVFDSDK